MRGGGGGWVELTSGNFLRCGKHLDKISTFFCFFFPEFNNDNDRVEELDLYHFSHCFSFFFFFTVSVRERCSGTKMLVCYNMYVQLSRSFRYE